MKNKQTSRRIYAKFYNKTGYDIDSLVIGTTIIGHLSINDSTEFISFRQFQFDGSFPYEKLKCNIQSKRLSQLNWSWCGTDHKTKSFGSYAFDIGVEDDIDSISLYLTNHGKKLLNR